MTPLLFWCFAVLMLGFGITVIAMRDPVASALSLVVSFICLAALFVLLDAYFIGTIQILVYAGAVMVLFLFIIMLLDLKAEKRRQANVFTIVGGFLVAILFIAQLYQALTGLRDGRQSVPVLASGGVLGAGDVRQIGFTIFSDYNLVLQIVGVLVLVATVGVIVLSKRALR